MKKELSSQIEVTLTGENTFTYKNVVNMPFALAMREMPFVDFIPARYENIITIIPQPLYLLYYKLPFDYGDDAVQYEFKNCHLIDGKHYTIIKGFMGNDLYCGYTIKLELNSEFIRVANSENIFNELRQSFFNHLTRGFHNITDGGIFVEDIRKTFIKVLKYFTNTSGALNDFRDEAILIEYEKYFNNFFIERKEYLQEWLDIRNQLLRYQRGVKPNLSVSPIQSYKGLIKGLACSDFINYLKTPPPTKTEAKTKETTPATDNPTTPKNEPTKPNNTRNKKR